jgi:hypothetical protein
MDHKAEVLKKLIAMRLAEIIFGLEQGEVITLTQIRVARDVMKAREIDTEIDEFFE